MTTKRLTKHDVGRFVRVVFSDEGASDGIVTRIDGPTDFRFLPLNNLQDGDTHNNGAPIVSIGRHVTAELSGLK